MELGQQRFQNHELLKELQTLKEKNANLSLLIPEGQNIDIDALKNELSQAIKNRHVGKDGIYDDAQFSRYKQLLKELQHNTITMSKEKLRDNDYKVSGKKSELIAWIANGMVLGRMPRCPRCNHGYLRFDEKTGAYSCPGYPKGFNFCYCDAKFAFEDIKREPWLD